MLIMHLQKVEELGHETSRLNKELESEKVGVDVHLLPVIFI